MADHQQQHEASNDGARGPTRIGDEPEAQPRTDRLGKPNMPNGEKWLFAGDQVRMPMNSVKAKEFLRSMLAVAVKPANTDGTTDPLVEWLHDETNSTTLLAVVRMMRTGEPQFAVLSLFDGVYRAGDDCDPWSAEPGNAYPSWRQAFVDVAQQLLDELAELDAPQRRFPAADTDGSAATLEQTAAALTIENAPPLLSLKQCAELIALAPNTIDAMERKGEFPPRRTLPAVRGSGAGKRVFIKREVEAWIHGTDWRALVRQRKEAGNG